MSVDRPFDVQKRHKRFYSEVFILFLILLKIGKGFFVNYVLYSVRLRPLLKMKIPLNSKFNIFPLMFFTSVFAYCNL